MKHHERQENDAGKTSTRLKAAADLSAPAAVTDSLLSFYDGTGTDSEGRTLDEILAWSDDRLESCHDYIQWLFPNDRPSAVNPDAPLVTALHREQFARRTILRQNLLQSLRRMLKFYGLKCVAEKSGARILRSAQWDVRKENWLTSHNHNHLRITRILISLRLLGLPEYAVAFFAELYPICHADGGGAISETTYAFWQAAIQ